MFFNSTFRKYPIRRLGYEKFWEGEGVIRFIGILSIENELIEDGAVGDRTSFRLHALFISYAQVLDEYGIETAVSVCLMTSNR